MTGMSQTFLAIFSAVLTYAILFSFSCAFSSSVDPSLTWFFYLDYETNTYELFNVLLQILQVNNRDGSVKHRVEEPEHIVDVVEILNVLLVILDESNLVEVKGVIGEKVGDQRDVGNCFPEHHSHWRLFVLDESFTDAFYKWNFLPKPHHFSCLGHAASEFS